MATATIEVTKTVTLTLTEAEAEWLKCVLQNPLYDVHPDEEDAEDAAKRKDLFKALKDATHG